MAAVDTARVDLVAIIEVLEQIERFKSALCAWNTAHQELFAGAQAGHRGGWISGARGLQSFQSNEAIPDDLRRALCGLESDEPSFFRASGPVFVGGELASLVQQAHQARIDLDVTSRPLRRLRAGLLARLPQGGEVGGGNLQHWLKLKPHQSIWRAVTATCGVPRLQIRYAVRPLLLAGAQPILPRKTSFSLTPHRVISRRHPEKVLRSLEEQLESAERADAARRDLSRLASLLRAPVQPDLAYIYSGDIIHHVNFTWGDGSRRKVKTSLPLFWCGPPIDIPPPDPAAVPRRRRSDTKYSNVPILETLPIYASIKGVDRLSSSPAQLVDRPVMTSD